MCSRSFLSDKIPFDRQHRPPSLFTSHFSPIPQLRNQDTFRMNLADMTHEQLVQHRQDENRGLSWREALSLWHTVRIRVYPSCVCPIRVYVVYMSLRV